MALRGKDGTLTASVSESCELLNKDLKKVFVRDDNQPISTTKEFNGVKLTTCAVTEENVMEHLMNLKVPSVPGSEGIHPVLLKKCAASVCKPLTLIFRKSLRTGQVPKDWTRANVTPIFKKGSRANPLNYRPISLTSVPCKIMEKIIRKNIVNHLEENNILTNHQHGFRSEMSCLTQLLEYFLDLKDALDEGHCVDAVYLDCRKAFDTVPHKRLLTKLKQVGIKGEVGLNQKLSERQGTEGGNQRNIFNLEAGERTLANSVPYLRKRPSR